MAYKLPSNSGINYPWTKAVAKIKEQTKFAALAAFYQPLHIIQAEDIADVALIIRAPQETGYERTPRHSVRIAKNEYVALL